MFKGLFWHKRNYTANEAKTNTEESESDSKEDSKSKEKVELTNHNVLPNTSESNIQTSPLTSREKFESYIKQDFEYLGRNDALTNPESNYLKLKIETLRSDMLSTAISAKIEIQDRINKLDAWIEINNRFANIDTSRRLVAEKGWHNNFINRLDNFIRGINDYEIKSSNEDNIIDEANIETTIKDSDTPAELKQQSNDALILNQNIYHIPDSGEARKLLLSYIAGFVKGVAALSYVQFLNSTK